WLRDAPAPWIALLQRSGVRSLPHRISFEPAAQARVNYNLCLRCGLLSDVNDEFRQPAVAVALDLQAVISDRLDLVAKQVAVPIELFAPRCARQPGLAAICFEATEQEMLRVEAEEQFFQPVE